MMRQHYNSLDGLRGIAAYTVVISHFTNVTNLMGGVFGFGAGKVGVMLFFVLSGFLMARLYMDKPLSNITNFYIHRFARVVPLFYFLVIFSYFWQSWANSRMPFYDVNNENIVYHLIFLKGTSVLWTIPVEIQFYLIFPFFWVAYRYFGKSGFVLLTGFTGVGILLFSRGAGIDILSYGYFFIAGMLVSILPKGSHHDGGFLLFLIMYIVLMPRFSQLFGITTPITVYWITTPFLLYQTLHSDLAKKTLGTPIMRFFGNISYSVYLWHLPILLYLSRTEIRQNLPLYFIVFIGVTTLVGWVSFRFFETPVRLFLIRTAEKKCAQ